jgi:HSP20 family protein
VDPFKHIARAWEGLTEGWRELLSRNSGALTHFINGAKARDAQGSALDFPKWGLLAAETWETAASVIVRIEVPGMKKEDLDIRVHGSTLQVRGEKRSGNDHRGSRYHLMERAYGRFERSIELPRNVDSARIETSYKDGIVTVILPKTEQIPPARPSSQ